MLLKAAMRRCGDAAAAAMTIVEPVSNGLGSDAFCILWDGQALHG
jgi:gamma-glutamyltranspeptidase/glutathione hydrolase